MTQKCLAVALALCLSLGSLAAPAQTADPVAEPEVVPGAAAVPPGLSAPRPRSPGALLGAAQPADPRRPGRKQPGADEPYDRDYDRYHQRRRPPTIVVIRAADNDLLPRVTLSPPTPVPAPAAPVVAAPTAPLNPHDGPRFVGARGAVPAAPVWTLDQPLPRDVPQLTLTSWRAYGLDAPGPGQSYVRIGSDLLLIDAASRRVLRALPPPN